MNDPVHERNGVLELLKDAVSLLEQSADPRLIPPDGLALVYAIRNARDKDGVAAVKGRIVNDGGSVHAAGPCVFGADERGTQIVLTVMRFDPAARSAAIISFLPATLTALEGMLLECCPVDRSREPVGISSMDWGVASCCKNGVPDVIFDRGRDGNDGRIFIFAEKPAVVANNIIICSNRM